MKNICIIFFFFLNLNSDNFLLTLQPEEFPVNANVAIPTINTFCMQEPSTDTTTNPINIYVNSWTFCRDSLSVLEQYDALYKDPLLQIGIFLHGPSNPPAKILGTPQGRRPCNAFFFFFFSKHYFDGDVCGLLFYNPRKKQPKITCCGHSSTHNLLIATAIL